MLTRSCLCAQEALLLFNMELHRRYADKGVSAAPVMSACVVTHVDTARLTAGVQRRHTRHGGHRAGPLLGSRHAAVDLAAPQGSVAHPGPRRGACTGSLRPGPDSWGRVPCRRGQAACTRPTSGQRECGALVGCSSSTRGAAADAVARASTAHALQHAAECIVSTSATLANALAQCAHCCPSVFRGGRLS